MKIQLKKGFKNFRSIGVVFSDEVVAALLTDKSIAVILVFRYPSLK